MRLLEPDALDEGEGLLEDACAARGPVGMVLAFGCVGRAEEGADFATGCGTTFGLGAGCGRRLTSRACPSARAPL